MFARLTTHATVTATAAIMLSAIAVALINSGLDVTVIGGKMLSWG